MVVSRFLNRFCVGACNGNFCVRISLFLLLEFVAWLILRWFLWTFFSFSFGFEKFFITVMFRAWKIRIGVIFERKEGNVLNIDTCLWLLGISANTFRAGKIEDTNSLEITFGLDIFHDLFVRADILVFFQDTFYEWASNVRMIIKVWMHQIFVFFVKLILNNIFNVRVSFILVILVLTSIKLTILQKCVGLFLDYLDLFLLFGKLIL